MEVFRFFLAAGGYYSGHGSGVKGFFAFIVVYRSGWDIIAVLGVLLV